jgi:hypothetical protein
VGVTIEIASSELLPALLEELSDGGCITHALDERTCRIVHPKALDPAEEWYELRFFFRAWQLRHGVEATFLPVRVPSAPRYGETTRSNGFSIKPCS